MTIRWEAAAGSHVGKVRKGNEDSHRSDLNRGVFLVADGMGGHAAGEVASAVAADTLEEVFADSADKRTPDIRERLNGAFHEIQQRLIDCCSEDPAKEGMGTTLTALHLSRAGSWSIGHIGDSRAYRLHGSSLEQLTADHTWVQQEVDDGRLSQIAAMGHHLSHILTRVLTDDGESTPDLLEGSAQPGDLFLLVTDGLYGMVDDLVIQEILLQNETLARRVERLIDAANTNGGIDNITAVLIEILPDAPTEAAPSGPLAGQL